MCCCKIPSCDICYKILSTLISLFDMIVNYIVAYNYIQHALIVFTWLLFFAMNTEAFDMLIPDHIVPLISYSVRCVLLIVPAFACLNLKEIYLYNRELICIRNAMPEC